MINPSLGSWLYRSIRTSVLGGSAFLNRFTGYPKDIEPAIGLGDLGIGFFEKSLGNLLFSNTIDPKHQVEFMGLSFASPLTFSAFWNHYASMGMWLRLGLGGGCLKTVLPEPRPGNPSPRIQSITVDGEDALINALGLPGLGTEGFLKEVSNHALFSFDRPIGLSVGGHKGTDYINVVTKAEIFQKRYPDAVPIAYYELNISCPNTPTGQNMMEHPELIGPLLKQLRGLTDKPIGVKISPDLNDKTCLVIAETVRDEPLMFINSGNTQFRTCEAVGLPKIALSRGGGGLSGAPLFKRTLELVKLIAPLKVPLMVTGGINSADKAQAVLASGASLIGMATALVQDPFVVPKILKQLK